MLSFVVLCLIVRAQSTVPASKDALGKERQLTFDYMDIQPQRIVRIGPRKISTGQQPDIDFDNSNKTLFVAGRSDIMFILSDVTDDQSLSMYRRQPGANPDKALWTVEWRSDRQLRNRVGLAWLLDCNIQRFPPDIRRTIASIKAFVCYWLPSIFAGAVADIYLPAGRHQISVSQTEGLEFPTTRVEDAYATKRRVYAESYCSIRTMASYFAASALPAPRIRT
jgi:hypothetical protein